MVYAYELSTSLVAPQIGLFCRFGDHQSHENRPDQPYCHTNNAQFGAAIIVSLLALPVTWSKLYSRCWCPLILVLLTFYATVNLLVFKHEADNQIRVFGEKQPGTHVENQTYVWRFFLLQWTRLILLFRS